MSNKAVSVILTAIIFSLPFSQPHEAFARAKFDRLESPWLHSLARISDPPYVALGCHNIGKIAMSVTNQGTFGLGFAGVAECPDGSPAPSTVYPINSNVDYLFAGAFWIGAVIGRDTLVSVGADGWQSTREMWPASLADQLAHGEQLTVRSISDPNDPEFFLALSEQDVTFAYFDTLTEGVEADPIDNRPHRPLRVKIRQTSYAWSYSYAEDFVLFDFKITNIDGRRTLEKVYMGIYVDGDVGHPDELDLFRDDICGFKLSVDQLQFENTQCQFVDTIRIAWLADNDGNNEAVDIPKDIKTEFTSKDPIGVVGTRIVRTPSDSLKFSFNWWVSNTNAPSDFGPRRKGVDGDPFRDFGGFLGTPEGDKNKYYIMSHEEFDYDQLFSAVDLSGEGWLEPGPDAANISDGFDTRYLLSFGPFTIFPGEELPITFAYVGGDNFHVHPQDKNNLFNPLQPDAFADALDFTDLGINAQWASWIYDNPGVDTDGDGFRGKARVCINDSTAIGTRPDTFFAEDGVTIDSIVIDSFFTDIDSVFYEGDGVPDFLGASPPPAPIVRLQPSPGSISVRWNGLRTETTVDPFSLALDFEGYRVFLGLSNRATDMILESSYDRENYTRFFWNAATNLWKIAGPPQTMIEVQDLYVNRNRSYDPLFNGIDNPLVAADSQFYFISQDWNRNDLTDTLEIYKPTKYRYNFNPNGSIMVDSLGNPISTPFPHTLAIDSAFTADTFLLDSFTGDTTWYMGGELTEDGRYFKYFEYAYELEGLLSSQLYFVSVTAFDFGAPSSGLDALETSPLLNVVSELPQNPTSVIEAERLSVIVYPNPYRIDGQYRDKGFEARINPLGLPEERTRAVHFTNLPAKCKIRIFTLDGDLVREIVHDEIPNSPGSMHDFWTLVTRNSQAAASGIYYWSVEEEGGRVQTGKLVLIM